MTRGGLTRGEAIAKGAVAVAAVSGLDMVAPYVGRALAKSGSDVQALNLLLKFEHMQVAIYGRAIQQLKPSGSLKELLETLAKQEDEHVEALSGEVRRLGGKPEPKGSYAFSYRGAYTLLRLAFEIEDATIAAYNGAIPKLKSNDSVALAASIVQVEGRHAAAIRIQRKQEPAPEAFDAARREIDALSSVERFAGPWIYY
jgi:rubrerythrin